MKLAFLQDIIFKPPANNALQDIAIFNNPPPVRIDALTFGGVIKLNIYKDVALTPA